MRVQELIDLLNKVEDKGKFIFQHDGQRVADIEETKYEVHIHNVG